MKWLKTSRSIAQFIPLKFLQQLCATEHRTVSPTTSTTRLKNYPFQTVPVVSNLVEQIEKWKSQIEVIRIFVSATDDFTSKSEITSHLNVKKLNSHNCVHDHAIFTENSQGYNWTDQWIYLDRSKTDDDSVFGQICHDQMNI